MTVAAQQDSRGAGSFPAARWQEEPFRIFFPLGVLVGWIGVGVWLVYALGLVETYSCFGHGLIVAQAFLVAIACGFLLTAVPRRTQSPPPSRAELCLLVGLPLAVTAMALARRWALAEILHAGTLLLLLRFVARRAFGRLGRRRPPASFLLIPLGALFGLGGALLLAWSTAAVGPPWTLALGRLLVEQGVFLCFTLGAGGVILALVAGKPPPADLGSSAAEGRRALGYASLGLGILATFVIEALGAGQLGPLLRAAVVGAGAALGEGLRGLPARPGLHRRAVWLAFWMMPLGLALYGLLPSYRVPALHVLFIGGFATMAFGVASHVSFGHLGLESHMRGRPWPVVALLSGLGLALAGRVAADVSHTYFAHLGWAAACWILGSAAWLAALAPRLWARAR